MKSTSPASSAAARVVPVLIGRMRTLSKSGAPPQSESLRVSSRESPGRQRVSLKRPVPTVAVLDHRADPFDALWANERVEAALATTGESADVLFWVVGLQDQYLAGTRARSTRCRAAY